MNDFFQNRMANMHLTVSVSGLPMTCLVLRSQLLSTAFAVGMQQCITDYKKYN